MAQPTILATIDAIMEDLAAMDNQELGGAAAGDARRNAADVADFLRDLARNGEKLGRHAGKPSSGWAAKLLTERLGRRFNRQVFFSNAWCERLLGAYGAWEDGEAPTALEEARASAEAKEPRDRRMASLQAELVTARAEIQQLRHELAHLRNFVAETGRMP